MVSSEFGQKVVYTSPLQKRKGFLVMQNPGFLLQSYTSLVAGNPGKLLKKPHLKSLTHLQQDDKWHSSRFQDLVKLKVLQYFVGDSAC